MLLQDLSIPIVSALVGWGTNLLAIKMMFYPLQPIGWPPWLGWQGVIPSKAAKMASKTVELMTTRLIDVDALFTRLETARVVEVLAPTIEPMIEGIIDDIMTRQAPRRWKLLPERLKQTAYARARESLPDAVEGMMREVGANLRAVLNIEQVCIDALLRDKRLLNRIFIECGAEEFRFIGWSGLGFGFVFGCVQMLVWILWPAAWVLPVAGLLVGHLTNWVALKMIFEPLEPRAIGPYRWQGLFLKRQAEVSEAYAKLVANHIVNPANLLHGIMRGPASDAFFEIIHRHVTAAADEYDTSAGPWIRFSLGSAKFDEIKKAVCDGILARIPRSLSKLDEYAEQALDIENTLRVKMQALPPEEFELLLHSAFKEDEFKLIAVGAALGACAGVGQLMFVFG